MSVRRKVLRVARKASRSVRLSCALGRQRDASYDRLVNNSKRSFGEMLSRASLGDNLVIQFTAFYMKKEIHVRPRLSNILVQKFFS